MVYKYLSIYECMEKIYIYLNIHVYIKHVMYYPTSSSKMKFYHSRSSASQSFPRTMTAGSQFVPRKVRFGEIRSQEINPKFKSLKRKVNSGEVSHEKNPLTFFFSWMVNRDPYNGLL